MATSSKAAATKSDEGADERAAMRARAAALLQGAGDDPVPRDIDEFRLELARRIMPVLGLPERCRERACRRGRRCAGRDLRCQRDFPAPPMTRDQEAEALARVQRMLKRRVESES
jgi:hypothetical protein